ncbi:MAG: FG-GAP repeat domain-containing protein, partial [Planctomycetota bacterium]
MKPGPNDKTRRAPRRLAALVLALLAASLSTGCSLGIALAIIELAGKDGGTTVDDNVAPSVTISTVMRTKGLVGIPVTVFDANNDDVTLTGTYDIGGGPQLATLIGSSVVTGSGAGTPALMTWDAPTDLGGTAYVGSVAFSFAGNDSKTNGPASTVAIFEFGNDSPTLNSVTVDTDPLGRVGDIAAVRFQVSDSSSDDVSVTSFEYSLLGDFSDAVVVPLTTGQGGNFPVGTLSGLSTTLALIEYSFAWDVASALETNQAGARIRVQLQDEFGDTSTVVQSPSFFLHTGGDPPSAFLIDIKEPDIDGERCGTILIVYELFDNDGQPADVRIEFSTDNKQTWTLCTEYPSLLSEGRYELAANDDGVVHWFVWDAPVDLVQHPTVHLRVTAADISGVGQPNETQFPLKIGLSEFNPADVFFTGGSTFGGAVGDVSGNSLLDFVVTNSQSNDVTVLLQQYDHRFVENGPFSTDGIGPRSPQLVDVTGDTLKDIVLVNSSSNQISVLEGDGAGDFPNTPILSNTGGVAGSAGSECALQNFTADAFPDIAVTNATSNNVTVLTNDGAGNFTLAATLTDGTEPRSVTTARFDAGATFDLAVANRSSDDVSIFLGNGDGTFGSAINVKVGLHPICVRAVHLNPDIDAIMDLAVTCNGDNSLWLLFGDGAGGFTTTNLPLAGGPSSVSVADHDGDGKNDLFVTLRQANRVAILIGNGTGGFALHTVYDTEPLPGFIATVDFDQDGHTDILMTHQSTGVTASVLLSRDTPSLTFASSDFYSTGLYPETVRTADLDMDGKLDLVVVNGGGDSETVLPGVGDGTFEFGFDYGTSTSPTD